MPNHDLMGSRKNLTIGVTVNLEHYENLRLEVTGEVGSADEARELAAFLDEVLGKFGRGDPVTAGRVDSYRARVLPGSHPSPVVPAQGSGRYDDLPNEEEDRPPVVEESSEAVPGPGTTAMAAPAPAQNPGGDGTPACEICGSTVTPAEQKMSRLFTSRTLCRECLRSL
jgi:hypothetical protein